MKKKRFAMILFFLCVLVMIVGTAFAFGGRWRLGWYNTSAKMIERRVERTADFLDLDDQQQQEFRKILEESYAKRKELFKNAEPLFKAVLDEAKNEQIDENRLLGLIEGNRAKMDEMVRFAIRKYAEFHALLKPEQRAKLVKVMEKISNRRQRRYQE